MLQSIVAPTDFSAGSRHAIDYAANLAARFEGTLWLLHVSASPLGEHERSGQGAAAGIYHAAREEQARVVHRQMADLVAALSETHPGLDIRVEYRSGVAYDAIIGAAEQVGADLIVMGTAGLTGFSHFLIGSTAERVVRLSKIPVLTVRAPR